MWCPNFTTFLLVLPGHLFPYFFLVPESLAFASGCVETQGNVVGSPGKPPPQPECLSKVQVFYLSLNSCLSRVVLPFLDPVVASLGHQ